MFAVTDPVETARVQATVSADFYEKLRSEARTYNMSISAYAGMLIAIGHQAFNRGQRLRKEEGETNKEG